MLQAATLWELIERRADATPDALMVVDEDMRTLTFAEYWAEAERAAAGLVALGVDGGDVVTWQLPTWIESMVLAGALSRIGAVQNLVLPIARRHELDFITEQVGSTLLVTPSTWQGFDYEDMAVTVARGRTGTRVLVADKALPQGDPVSLPPFGESNIDASGERTDWIFYTSGTTAEPKGVRHSHATISAAALGLAERLELIPRDRNSLVFPITHIGGMVWLFASLQSGCTNICTEVFDPERTVEVLSREGVTLAGSGTYFHQRYIDQQRSTLTGIFPDVRAFVGGGAPKPVTLADEVAALFDVPVLSGFGMTEAPIVTMASMDDTPAELATTEGRPTSGVDIRITDPDGHETAPGDEGEIRVRGPQVMLGYVDPSLDREAFDDDGFLRTGDMGWLDPGGNLVVSGRLKDIIVRKGENISARELEELLGLHPLVADVAVIGLPDPDAGERVCAVVQLNDVLQPLTHDAMVEHLYDIGLARQKVPEQLEYVDQLPRNSAGKVLKHLLRDEFKG